MEHPGYYPSKRKKIDIHAMCLNLLKNLIEIDLCEFLEHEAQVLDTTLSIRLLQPKFVTVQQPIHQNHSQPFTATNPEYRRYYVVQSLPVSKLLLRSHSLHWLYRHLDKARDDPLNFLSCAILVVEITEVCPVQICLDLICCLLVGLQANRVLTRLYLRLIFITQLA